MSKKGFDVSVELNIQKVTCPGVYLCSNGRVALQIYMLDCCTQTENCKPSFPLQYREKYVFHKTFAEENRLNELQRSLNDEWLYLELIQWQNCEEGTVLATFRTTLDEFLFPTSMRGSLFGVELELLMVTTKAFPGAIAPKVEISTKTSIDETIIDLSTYQNSSVRINPTQLFSMKPNRKGRTRKVCHSVAYSRAMKHSAYQPKDKNRKPPFVCRKVDDDLILRNNPNVVLKSEVPQESSSEEIFVRRKPSFGTEASSSVTVPLLQSCCCTKKSHSMGCCCKNMPPQSVSQNVENGTGYCCKHLKNTCPTCSNYLAYFSSSGVRSAQKLCSFCERPVKKTHIKSKSGSPCHSDVSEKRVCFCIPCEKTKSMAQKLHERLSESIEANCRMLKLSNSCINCEDYL